MGRLNESESVDSASTFEEAERRACRKEDVECEQSKRYQTRMI